MTPPDHSEAFESGDSTNPDAVPLIAPDTYESPGLPTIRLRSRSVPDEDGDGSSLWESEDEEADDEIDLWQSDDRMAAPASDDLPDPHDLFLQMQAQADAHALDDDDLPDPSALFEKMRRQSAEVEEDLPDPNALFEQMRALERAQEPDVDDELPDPDALFQQMLRQEERFQQSRPEDDLPDPEQLFLRMQAQSASETLGDDELPDPDSLFQEMLAREGVVPARTPAAQTGVDDEHVLPDPEELFRRMQSYEARSPDPVEEEKLPFFQRLKRKFTRSKVEEVSIDDAVLLSIGDAEAVSPEAKEVSELPDPVELFRQMSREEVEGESVLPSPEELFRRLKGDDGDSEDLEVPSGLPALPDLDAIRAELEAEEQARLDPDLLGDLSGPERFAETVSDLEFRAGSSFQAPVIPDMLKKPTTDGVQDKRAQPKDYEPARPVSKASPSPVSQDSDPRTGPTGTVRVPPSQEAALAATASLKAPYRGTASSRPSSKGRSGSAPTETKPSALSLWARTQNVFKRRVVISRYSLSIFTRQLSAMLKAGIALQQSVAFCAESDPQSADILHDVVMKVEQGYTFSAALEAYPDSFDEVYVGLIHSGELSGRLNEMLGRLADLLEREIDLRKRIISVITYPSVLLGVSLLGTLGFIFFILPQLTPMFLDLKVDLPWPTLVLLKFRDLLVPIIAVGSTLLLAFWLFRTKIRDYVRARPALQRRLAAVPFQIPVVGPVIEMTVTARVLYSLSTLLEVGVTMNQALARSERAAGNAYVAWRLKKAREELIEGSSVTECFQIHQVFPPTALHLIGAGEESARLVEMFAYVAKHFDQEVEYSMESAASLLEPLIMMVMGIVVGFITIAAAMPTIKLLQNFG